MVRDRAGRTACHRLLERPQAPLCLGAQTAPSHPTSSRYRSNAESRIDLADAPLNPERNGETRIVHEEEVDPLPGTRLKVFAGEQQFEEKHLAWALDAIEL